MNKKKNDKKVSLSRFAQLKKKLAKANAKLKTLKTGCQKPKKAQEMQYRQLLSIFDSIDDPVYVVDPQNYEILFVNKAIKKTFGNVAGKKCYKSFQSLEFPCNFCTNKYIFGKYLGKSYIWDFQNRFNQRWYHCIDKAIRWTDGRMVRYEMAIDITERKKAEDALVRCNHLLEKALYNLRDAVFVFDAKIEKIIDCNLVAPDIFGYSRQEILKLTAQSLFAETKAFNKFKEFLRSAVEENGFLSNTSLPMKRKDGSTFNVKCDMMPLSKTVKEITGWVCIASDIGNKKEN